jgi:dolichol-phosphate mannosyltransferase
MRKQTAIGGYMGKKLSVVVPTFNEAGNEEVLAAKVGEALQGIDHEIWFIDDSEDDTPEVLERLCAADSRCRFIHREGEARTGLATAVIEGFHAA